MLPSSTGLQASVELSDVTLSLSSSLYSKAVLSILIKKKKEIECALKGNDNSF